VTADVLRRVYEHREGAVAGFTQRYWLKRPVYFERHEEIVSAIQRVKTIKGCHRAWKVRLIQRFDPEWKDLYLLLV
jgi:putative endonuclease